MLKVLIFSGANNHDWKRSTPYCKELLERTGKFAVDVSISPEVELEDWEKLQQYDLIFMDYNGPDWSEKAKRNFSSIVQQGTGLFVLHAANNAFQDWEEYGRMIGMTFKKGHSGHGKFHEFNVRILDQEHPVTRGMPEFKTCDELYHRMVIHENANCQVLAEAWSDPEQKGTGEIEPLIVVLEYGKGRVFHLMLGHVWPDDFNGNYPGYHMTAFENPYFQDCVTRGAEWAATGQVHE